MTAAGRGCVKRPNQSMLPAIPKGGLDGPICGRRGSPSADDAARTPLKIRAMKAKLTELRQLETAVLNRRISRYRSPIPMPRQLRRVCVALGSSAITCRQLSKARTSVGARRHYQCDAERLDAGRAFLRHRPDNPQSTVHGRSLHPW